MLLDKLLDYVTVHSEPFATCLLSSGWRLSLPGPPGVMFHFVMQGRGVLRGPEGEQYSLERFSLAVVPSGVTHTLECGPDVRSERVVEAPPTGEGIVRLVAGSQGSTELRVACGAVNVTYGDSLGLFQRLREIIVADLSGYPQVRSAFEGILAEQGGATEGSATLTRALMTQCIVYLLRYLSEQSDGRLSWLPGLEDPNLSRAVDVMFEHPEAPHSVDSLADEAIMSRSVFAERFRAAFGSTPISFLHDLRLRRAAEQLRQKGETSVEQIAHRVGFNSRSHFSRAFKDHFGVSPAAFRESLDLR
jgi:AraC family transcriptional activator of mtrCDE